MFATLGILVLFACVAATALCIILLDRKWKIHLWFPGYAAQAIARRRRPRASGPIDVMFCFVDHFEPGWHRPDFATERRRVATWVERYPKSCAGIKDADGCSPKHTFFYPEEEYAPEHLDDLVGLCRGGYGEIEVHLHHDRDTSEGLKLKLRRFINILTERHQALSIWPDSGRPAWGFIHGNWALDNSRPDGRWCGVNDEISILAEEGCYADFTFPSAPDSTQPRMVNRIYYALDDRERPRSHDSGRLVRVGDPGREGLLMINGPLGIRLGRRGRWPIPRLENADLRQNNPPSRERVDAWLKAAVAVEGRPEWRFIKIHTHGTQDGDMETLLGEKISAMYLDLAERFNDGKRFRLHFVCAREAFNIVKAAQAGERGDPGRFRDFILPPPRFMSRANVSTAVLQR